MAHVDYLNVSSFVILLTFSRIFWGNHFNQPLLLAVVPYRIKRIAMFFVRDESKKLDTFTKQTFQ
jgi:hypothetical protein